MKAVLLLFLMFTSHAQVELLIKLKGKSSLKAISFISNYGDVEIISRSIGPWVHLKASQKFLESDLREILNNNNDIEYIQKNYEISLINNFQINDPILREMIKTNPLPFPSKAPSDNPPIPTKVNERTGQDPKLSSQWGMQDIGLLDSWRSRQKEHDVTIAVLDTGVDYTHEDIQANLWRNPGEMGQDENGKDKSTNGVDDDNNGFVDDLVGWDFVSNDNLPYDLTLGLLDILTKGGNPGHGTHCAGNVAARGNNGLGISGVAPNAKIMILRFLSEKGRGTTAGAVKSLDYAINNGAKVLSNSWGSSGEDPNDQSGNKALKDMIRYAQEKGSLFIAAAGNGIQGVGYDNDTSNKPAIPASYDMDVIISVAAIDDKNQLGKFSNWGKRTVDIAAPGVKVFSTVPGTKYTDVIIDLFGMKVTWDGTSMATPHVAGAAGLYWSRYPEKTWQEVKQVILDNSTPLTHLSHKMTSGGKLDLRKMLP